MHIEVILDVNRGKKKKKIIELGMIPLHVVPGTAYADFFFIRKAKAGQKRKKIVIKKKTLTSPAPPLGSMGSLKKCSATAKYYAGILWKATESARCPASQWRGAVMNNSS